MNHHKKLSIIIPFYGQTVEELAVPLQSINRQINIDFNEIDVHLVNDAGQPIDPEQLKVFSNLDLHYHELTENVGPGLARQYGIDHSDSEWIMFVDADDELNGETALAYFYRVEKFDSQAQVLMSDFIIETKDVNKQLIRNIYSYQSDYGSGTVWAKWFRRDFINSIHLRFPEKSRALEDTYFSDIAMLMGDKIIGFNGAQTYLYHYRENSIIHNDGAMVSFDVTSCMVKERLELEFLLEYAPEKFERRMDISLVGLYFYRQIYPTVDETAFISELSKYAQEFLPIYKIKFAKLSQLVKTESLQNGSLFFGLEISGFKAFLDLIKQQTKRDK